jgi:CheY-like chemotaxis protein
MKILLVDDSKTSRYTLRLQLQRYGVEVITAESAEDAFERLKGELPDAILIDQLMPRLNGLEAIEIIHGNPRTAHLPVVICTTHENTEVAAFARQRGAAGTLTKSKAAEEIPELLVRLSEGEAHWPSAHSTGLASTAQTVHRPAPELDPNPELLRLIEERIEARIEARLTGLIEPLLQDLERSLSERLLASVRQLIESQVGKSQVGESRGLIEQRLANGRQAAGGTPTKRPSTELESATGHLVVEPLSQVHNRMTPVYLAILGAVVFNLLVLFLAR